LTFILKVCITDRDVKNSKTRKIVLGILISISGNMTLQIAGFWRTIRLKETAFNPLNLCPQSGQGDKI